MLKRRGNFPYDSNTAYPAYPTPAAPHYPVQTPTPPPPDIPPPVQSAPPPAESAAPVATPQPIPAAILTPTPEPPPIHTEEVPKIPPRKPRRRIAPTNQPLADTQTPDAPHPDESDASRHARKCAICNHPEREAIDNDIINWIKPRVISFEFGVSDQTIRRHARATGIDGLRLRNCRSALGLIIERAMGSKITGDTVIRAIRAASCISESGQWIEQPKRVIFTVEHVQVPATSPGSAAPALPPANDNPVLELTLPVTSDGVLIDRHID